MSELAKSPGGFPETHERLRTSSPRRTAGFTLVELAICLAVLATLMMVVFISKGFIADFREDQTITTAIAIQKAAPIWSERRNGGMGYGGGSSARSISKSDMCNYRVLAVPNLANGSPDCNRVATAWKTDYEVTPYFPSGWPTTIPTSRIQIKFCVPNEQGVEVAKTIEAKLKATKSFDTVGYSADGTCGGGWAIRAVSNK